jgi:hypothetical protein
MSRRIGKRNETIKEKLWRYMWFARKVDEILNPRDGLSEGQRIDTDAIQRELDKLRE